MAQKDNIQVSFGISGMERQNFSHLVDEKTYTFMLNGNIETDDESIGLTNEHSNILCSKFKPGYVVIGHKYDTLNSRVWFLLTQKDSYEREDGEIVRDSEIGYISVSNITPDLSDINVDCGCDMESILSKPLEDFENNIEYCNYTTLISDECNNCLNFDPNYPAHNIILKQEACGFTMTFATKNNPPRYIILDKIDYYRHKGDINCGIDNTEITCIDCDKIRLFPLYEQPLVTPEFINYGGNLKRGSYEYFIAYCDKMGNELTSYISATNPVHIFDKENIQLDQTDRFGTTNYAVKLKVENLDKRFNFYKVVVVERTDVNEVVTVYEEGIHSISDINVTHTSSGSQNDKRINLNRLFVERPVYKNFGGITTSNGILFGYDYEVEKEWNLQPVVNLLGSFVKWQTVESSEDLYKDGVNTSLYKSFMRDEVYPLGIKFTTDTGYKTSLFPLTARPPKSNDLIEYAPDFNKDVKSILNNGTNCGTSDRRYKWQFYNTGNIIGDSFSDIIYSNGKIVPKDVDNTCIQNNVKNYDNIEIEIDINEDFYNLQEWISIHKDELCDTNSEYFNDKLCDMITDDVTIPCDIEESISYPLCDNYEECYDKYCDPASEYYDYEKCQTIEKNCIDGECTGICSDVEIVSSDLYISSIQGENIELIEKEYPETPGDTPEYEHTYSTAQCFANTVNNPLTIPSVEHYDDEGNVKETHDISIWGGVTSLKISSNIAQNTSCTSAVKLPAISQNISSEVYGDVSIKTKHVFWGNYTLKTDIIFYSKENVNYFKTVPTDYHFAIEPLLSDINARNIEGFETKIAKNALWYSVDFENDEQKLFEITPIKDTGKCKTDTSSGDGIVRYTIFDKCKNGTILESGTYDVKDGLFIVMSKVKYGRKNILISIDTKIKKHVASHAWIYDQNDTRLLLEATDSFYMTEDICGCFDVLIRPKEYYKVIIKSDNIEIDKMTMFTTSCKFNTPPKDECGVIPHKYGEFAYWESVEEYPDNQDLYNSSNIKVNLDKLNHEDDKVLETFSDYFMQGTDEKGDIIWKEKNGKPVSDFTCTPIRHFKFPDNTIVPFMNTQPLVDFAKSRIYPIGVTIDERTIEVFLDMAVDSGLLTLEQRGQITGYELYRGDRSVNKSIIYKGIANDMYEDSYEMAVGQRTFFRNFPYNSLGKNQFITRDKERKELLQHPFPGSSANNRFSLIAPEVYYNRPSPPSEMSVEGYMFGKAVSGFIDVKDHSEWVILGDSAYSLADKLAKAEIVLEAALNIATLTLQGTQNNWFMVGLAGGGNPIGSVLAAAAIGVYSGIQMSNLLTVKLPKLKTQWLEIFEQRGSVYNFASMYVSPKGFYNSFKPSVGFGSRLRGLETSKYLNNGIDAFTEIENDKASITLINNKDRENSLYLYTGEEYEIKYPKEYMTYDNTDISLFKSSRYISSNIGCTNEINGIKNIASPYFSMKNYVPDQYGKIDEIKWLSLNNDKMLRNESKNIFGGDTFISRVDLKNKMKLFNKTAVDLANRTPFKYSTASNVGYTRFYVDHKSAEEDTGLVNDMPYLSSKYNLDCRQNSRKFYEGDPSKFYLYAYGMPYFLIESEINANFRYVGKEPHEQFASIGLNVEDWVQEKNVSIAHNNIFYYNNVYSRNQTGLSYRTLPSFYERETWDCLSEAENGVAWSEEDNSEVSLSDPWLVFKPFNIYRFPFSYGKLISLNPLESTQVMGRFSDNMAIFNSIDVLKERITPDNVELGTGGIFAQRPVEFSHTDLGETGSQHKSMVSCEFGHFWVDAKRGKVFQLEPNAKGLSAISDFKKSGGESGMRKWFKRHLPFKILNQGIHGITEANIDNHFKGLGILMWWDSRFKRVFISKRDYVVQPGYKGKIHFSAGNVTYVDGDISEKIEYSNSKYFKDVSWTVAFSPIYNNWVSYYDFKPDYAIAFNDYFQTGINYTDKERKRGVWSHLITNKSYQVFYGDKYPWTIEIPVKNTYTNNVMEHLKIWSQSKRYHNDYDYAMWRKKSFNKLIIYNQTNNSGLLNLNYDDSMNKSKYPIRISDTEQGIQASHFDEQIWINYFYNRVKKEDSHVPIWNWDENEINKQLNSDAVSFSSKRVLERLRGDWFTVRLTQDKDTQFKQYFKWMVSVQEAY